MSWKSAIRASTASSSDILANLYHSYEDRSYASVLAREVQEIETSRNSKLLVGISPSNPFLKVFGKVVHEELRFLMDSFPTIAWSSQTLPEKLRGVSVRDVVCAHFAGCHLRDQQDILRSLSQFPLPFVFRRLVDDKERHYVSLSRLYSVFTTDAPVIINLGPAQGKSKLIQHLLSTAGSAPPVSCDSSPLKCGSIDVVNAHGDVMVLDVHGVDLSKVWPILQRLLPQCDGVVLHCNETDLKNKSDRFPGLRLEDAWDTLSKLHGLPVIMFVRDCSSDNIDLTEPEGASCSFAGGPVDRISFDVITQSTEEREKLNLCKEGFEAFLVKVKKYAEKQHQSPFQRFAGALRGLHADGVELDIPSDRFFEFERKCRQLTSEPPRFGECFPLQLMDHKLSASNPMQLPGRSYEILGGRVVESKNSYSNLEADQLVERAVSLVPDKERLKNAPCHPLVEFFRDEVISSENYLEKYDAFQHILSQCMRPLVSDLRRKAIHLKGWSAEVEKRIEALEKKPSREADSDTLLRAFADDFLKKAVETSFDEASFPEVDIWYLRAASRLLLAELDQISRALDGCNVTTEALWRELAYWFSWHLKDRTKLIEDQKRKICNGMLRFALLGFPIELIDGENSAIHDAEFIHDIDSLWKQDRKRILVISVLGAQNAGKSTLMNRLFGVNFSVSPVRCTRGMNVCFLRSDDSSVPNLILLDTEGLFSLERGMSPRFDIQLTLQALRVSDVAIVKTGADVSTTIANVLSLAVYALTRLSKEKTQVAKLHFIMGDKPQSVLDDETRHLEEQGAQRHNLRNAMEDMLREGSQETSASLREIGIAEGDLLPKLLPNATSPEMRASYRRRAIEIRAEMLRTASRFGSVEEWHSYSVGRWHEIIENPWATQFQSGDDVTQSTLIENAISKLRKRVAAIELDANMTELIQSWRREGMKRLLKGETEDTINQAVRAQMKALLPEAEIICIIAEYEKIEMSPQNRQKMQQKLQEEFHMCESSYFSRWKTAFAEVKLSKSAAGADAEITDLAWKAPVSGEFEADVMKPARDIITARVLKEYNLPKIAEDTIAEYNSTVDTVRSSHRNLNLARFDSRTVAEENALWLDGLKNPQSSYFQKTGHYWKLSGRHTSALKERLVASVENFVQRHCTSEKPTAANLMILTQSPQSCCVCTGQYPASGCTALKDCSHIVCDPCWKSHLLAPQEKDRTEPSCPYCKAGQLPVDVAEALRKWANPECAIKHLTLDRQTAQSLIQKMENTLVQTDSELKSSGWQTTPNFQRRAHARLLRCIIEQLQRNANVHLTELLHLLNQDKSRLKSIYDSHSAGEDPEKQIPLTQREILNALDIHFRRWFEESFKNSYRLEITTVAPEINDPAALMRTAYDLAFRASDNFSRVCDFVENGPTERRKIFMQKANSAENSVRETYRAPNSPFDRYLEAQDVVIRDSLRQWTSAMINLNAALDKMKCKRELSCYQFLFAELFRGSFTAEKCVQHIWDCLEKFVVELSDDVPDSSSIGKEDIDDIEFRGWGSIPIGAWRQYFDNEHENLATRDYAKLYLGKKLRDYFGELEKCSTKLGKMNLEIRSFNTPAGCPLQDPSLLAWDGDILAALCTIHNKNAEVRPLYNFPSLDVVKEDLFTQADGCQDSCPLCGCKCTLPAGHTENGSKHTAAVHLLRSFSGSTFFGTKQVALRHCNDPRFYDRYLIKVENDKEVDRLPRPEYFKKYFPAWEVLPVSHNAEYQELIVTQIAAWKQHGPKFLAKYGVENPSPENTDYPEAL